MTVIREVMSHRVVTISSDATLHEAAKTLCKNDISAAPVVSPSGELVGLISETNLIDLLFDEEAGQKCVTECMTREVHVVCADDSLADAARLLTLWSIRWLPVLEKGRLVGLVSLRELLNYTVSTGEKLTDPLVELIPSLSSMS